MKRHLAYALAWALLLAVVVAPRAASATACTIPNTFTAGTPAVAAQVNSNFTSLQTCGNNIDHANIGAAGIYASQIIPDSTAHATFGGSSAYTFPTSINLNGASGVSLVAGSNANGNASFGLTATGANNFYAGCTGTSISCTMYFYTNGTGSPPTATLSATGTFTAGGYTDTALGANSNVCTEGTKTLVTSTCTFVPAYASGGVLQNSNVQFGSITVTFSGSCATGSSCTLTGNTINFTPAFASTAYSCHAQAQPGGFPLVTQVQHTTASTATLFGNNFSGSTIGGGTTETYDYICVGAK